MWGKSPGSWWRGRSAPPFDDDQIIEQARQRLVDERVRARNDLITELTVDPDRAYREHRAEYERTGDLLQLEWALTYVRPEGAP